MSRWYSPRRLSNEKKAKLKRLRAEDEAWRTENNIARFKLDEQRRIDALVRRCREEGVTDRDAIAARTGLGKFAIALSERRLAGDSV